MAYSQITGVKLADRDSVNEWVLKREGTIGSSSIASCYPGKHGKRIGYDTPVELYQRLRGFMTEREPNNAMLTGMILQPSVEFFTLNSQYFRQKNAVRVPDACEVLFRHSELHQLTATPDMVVEIDNNKGEREEVIVEIKTTSMMGAWRIKTNRGTVWRIPERVYLQLQHQLDVLGLDTGYVVCYPLSKRTPDMDEPVWISHPIKKDEGIVAANHYWAKAMLACCDEATSPILSEWYAKNSPEDLGDMDALRHIRQERTITASEELTAKVGRAAELKRNKEQGTDEFKTLTTEIKSSFGLCDEMVDEHGTLIATFKGGEILDEDKFLTFLDTHGVNTHDIKTEDLVLAYPMLVAQCVSPSSSRRLWLK